MHDPVEKVRAAHDFLNDMDWELLEEGVAMGTTAWRFLRDHPWMMVAAGAALSGIGGWFMVQDKRGGRRRMHSPRVSHEYTPAP